MKDIREFESIQIKLASPEQIRNWSHGEVKKAETINYRTLRPEKDGLFCEKIFGTTKEWECYCGKFKSIRYKGVICDRCGVEVTNTKVRRERMGHIALASPVAHIWYYKSSPSRIASLLGVSVKGLQSVISYEHYIVIDAGDTDLEKCQILKEDEYWDAVDEYGSDRFVVGMGAEAVKTLLENLDLDELAEELKAKIKEKNTKDDKLSKRLTPVEEFRNSGNRPEWMILTVLPVIPPDLRPMVQLDGGRFATSDLNDLYRRVINRNNRLLRLYSLNAPEIIVRNEKRMLQEAVDTLFDNSKKRKATKRTGKKPLKSLSDLLKGKQGRFRQNLLGKRVDYSGRSVIVVGPELKMHQCGVPSKMALELYKPFIMRKLVQSDIALNIKKAKNLVEQETPEVWAILDEVVKEHPVLLNRAPTLHRLGIQAFEPVLVDGKAILLHPLVCHAFNADFDGDQMAIHVPLTHAAQIECWTLMLSATNLLDPANGKPIVYPSQDMVLGIFYLTKQMDDGKGFGNRYDTIAEIEAAIEAGSLSYNAPIKYRFKDGLELVAEDGSSVVADGKTWFDTTPGRIIFNASLPLGVAFQNYCLGDKQLKKLIGNTISDNKASIAIKLLDSVKDCGYKYATIFGATIGLSDMIVPEKKAILVEKANERQDQIMSQYMTGQITHEERYNSIIELWAKTNDDLTDELMTQLKDSQKGFNPLYLMAESGARGSRTQIRQLGGMRGLMARPNGDIIAFPIKANFKEGLSIIEFFISTNGARKGLSDTALKTATAGYLTRKLVDASQDVVVNIDDCHTINGIWREAIKNGDEIVEHLADRIVGRCPLEDVLHPYKHTDDGKPVVLAFANEEINEETAKQIEDAGIERVYLRTVLTCEAKHGVCRKCYGRNLATNRPVEIGEAVGIVAAQSIGQPGTQLTMRTFHVGGTASASQSENQISFGYDVIIGKITGNLVVRDSDKKTIFPRKGNIEVFRIMQEITGVYDELLAKETKAIAKGAPLYIKNGVTYDSAFNGLLKEVDGRVFVVGKAVDHKVVPGSELYVNENDIVKAKTALVEFDPFSEPIISEVSGKVFFSDIIDGSTLVREIDDVTGNEERKIAEHIPKSLEPKIIVTNEDGTEDKYILPGGSSLFVENDDKIGVGQIIAKLAKTSQKTSDITGGLPRVIKLVEASVPKLPAPAVLAVVTGTVRVGEMKSEKRDVFVVDAFLKEHKHVVPRSANLLVRDGDTITAGEQITDGPINPKDILRIKGENALQTFLVDEIQEVYKMQGIDINDKHLGVVIRQMLRKVTVVHVGDSEFVKGMSIDKNSFAEENARVIAQGGQPAIGKSLLLGVAKSAKETESFISTASFEQTTKALTMAALAGKKDRLRGLKENVIIGRLIPAGTGMKKYRDITLDDENMLEQQKLVDEAKQSNRKEVKEEDDFDVAEDFKEMISVGDDSIGVEEFADSSFDDEE